MIPDPLSLSDFPAGPKAGTIIAAISDLAATGSKSLTFKEGDSQLNLIVHQTDQGIKAYINSCPHARVPLNLFGDTFLDMSGTYLICQTHGARFDPETGECILGPCKGDFLTPIKIAVTNNKIIAV